MSAFAESEGVYAELHDLHVGRLEMRDIRTALAKGLADFSAIPSHYIVLAVIYPAIGALMFRAAAGADMFMMLFPIISGFALVGPVAAIGLFEISRRREMGEDVSWRHVASLLHAPGRRGILVVALVLAILYAAWLIAAHLIYEATLGKLAPDGMGAFAGLLFSTGEGWTLILLGNAVGAGFALVAMVLSVFSLPMLLDGEHNPLRAMAISVRACAANWPVMLSWGVVVAVIVAVACIPAFAGLAVALPVLAHATWHLYRRAIRHED
ncbi:MAG: DUF2189 domain-containing protein [Alphaproteobacteria bacterium]|nr:MAG: DUF2189 domain-containing protein [Alphaproteobacteria bacterium]